jgi:predicted MPP superfamily phosphohydrolase
MSKIAIIIGAVAILTFYGGSNYYIGRKLFQWLKLIFPHINGMMYTTVFVILALSMIMVVIPLPPAINGFMSGFGSYWLGIFLYLLVFLLVADLVILLGSVVKLIPRPIPQSVHFYTSLSAILLTVGFVSYGIYNATQIKSVSYDIQTKDTVISPNMKIVLISDLHLGATHSEKRLQNPEKAMDLFKSLKATYGVYGVLGNHDGGKTFDKMVDFLKQSHIELLNDEYIVIDERLALFGRVDPSPIGGFGKITRKDISEVISSLDSNMPVVVMDHTPSKLGLYSDQVDLVLSGHTHRGQIFPGSLITNAVFEVDYGTYQRSADSPHFIVSSGVGTWGMPMRVGSNNEIVTINLH